MYLPYDNDTFKCNLNDKMTRSFLIKLPLVFYTRNSNMAKANTDYIF